MRYFLTTDVGLSTQAGGRTFKFESVSLRGGSWLGVLAVDDDSAASSLAAANYDWIAEISEARYESEKKKIRSTPTVESALRSVQKRQEQPLPAAPAISPTIPDGRFEQDGSFELKTTKNKPPREQVLEEPSMKKRGRPGRPAVKPNP